MLLTDDIVVNESLLWLPMALKHENMYPEDKFSTILQGRRDFFLDDKILRIARLRPPLEEFLPILDVDTFPLCTVSMFHKILLVLLCLQW